MQRNKHRCLSLITVLAFSSNTAFAGKRLSDSQLVTQCKTNLAAQLGEIQKSSLKHLKRRGQKFTAKFSITAEKESGLYLCTISPDQDVQIVSLDKQQANLAKSN